MKESNLHRLWGQASTRENYNKELWTGLQAELENLQRANRLLAGGCEATLGYIAAIESTMRQFISLVPSPILSALKQRIQEALAAAREADMAQVEPGDGMEEMADQKLQAARLTLKAGDRVLVRHDDGSEREHTVTVAPWQLGHGTCVLGLSGISGGYSLSRVTRVLKPLQ